MFVWETEYYINLESNFFQGLPFLNVLFLCFSKSPTGVDWFILETELGQAPRIHRAVDYWARHIVEQANNIPTLPMARPIPPPVVRL